MDYPQALALVGCFGVLAGTGASIFKTLKGKDKCPVHDDVMEAIKPIPTNTDLIKRLVDVTEKLEEKMEVSEKDRQDLHQAVKTAFLRATSWFEDIKLVLDLMVRKMVENKDDQEVIKSILDRKKGN